MKLLCLQRKITISQKMKYWKLFAKAIEQCKEKVLYVCRKCSFGLRGVFVITMQKISTVR